MSEVSYTVTPIGFVQSTLTDPSLAPKQGSEGAPDALLVQLCTLLGVSRSWFYDQPHQPTQAHRDVALRDAIERIVLEFGATATGA